MIKKFSLKFIGLVCLTIFISTILISNVKAQDESISYSRLYSDDKGITHFADDKFVLYSAYHGDVKTVMQTPLQKVHGFNFLRAVAGWSVWHSAKRKQFIFVLKGSMEIEAGDGEKRILTPGDIILVEDMNSEGHKTANAGGKELLALIVSFPL